MKKKLYFAAFISLLSVQVAQAQITLERLYNTQIGAHRLSTGAVKYAGFFATGAAVGQIHIYNSDHSLYRQVPVTLPNGTRGGSVLYVSDNLFNSNASLEMVINYYSTGNIGMKILDENGSQIMALDSTVSPQIYSTPMGTKMLCSYSTGSRSYSRIFSLPGVYTPLKTTTGKEAEQLTAYPNPAQAVVNIPYTISAGQIGSLRIYDTGGRVVKTYQVDNHIDHLEVSTQDLRPGVYVYTVETTAGISSGQRFVVE